MVPLTPDIVDESPPLMESDLFLHFLFIVHQIDSDVLLKL